MLAGKTAIVTGSTRGIGAAIARALAAQGCNVMLNGMGSSHEIEELRAGLESAYGVRVFHHGANLMNPPEIHNLVEYTGACLGGPDILVNNAGIQHVAPVEKFPRDKWDAVLAVNLSAAFHAIHYSLPHMKMKGWGRIINVASVLGLVASVNKAAYVASKHGLVGLTKVVALETAGSGITCNAVCPGWARTPLTDVQIEARAAQFGIDFATAAHQLVTEKQPSGEFIEVDHIAQLVAFLCSEFASQITGAALPIDGGWTAQ